MRVGYIPYILNPKPPNPGIRFGSKLQLLVHDTAGLIALTMVAARGAHARAVAFRIPVPEIQDPPKTQDRTRVESLGF